MTLVLLAAVKAIIALGLGSAAFYSADLLASPWLRGEAARTALAMACGTAVIVGLLAMMGPVDLGAAG